MDGRGVDLAVALAVGLVGWSLIANLRLGEHLYVTRNLLLTAALLGLGLAVGLQHRTIGLGPDDLGAGAAWGGAAVVLAAVVVAVGLAVGDRVDPLAALLSDARADLPPDEVAYQTLVRIPLGTALFEEVAFRGVLLALLLQVTTVGWAVTWSSVAFGLWHIAPTIVALRLNDVEPMAAAGLRSLAAAVFITAIAGALFCLLRLVSGSLLAPTLAHWATNSLGLAAAAAHRSFL